MSAKRSEMLTPKLVRLDPALTGVETSILNLKFSGLQNDSKIADSSYLGRIGYGSTLCSAGAE
jgi:hypothetical protein